MKVEPKLSLSHEAQEFADYHGIRHTHAGEILLMAIESGEVANLVFFLRNELSRFLSAVGLRKNHYPATVRRRLKAMIAQLDPDKRVYDKGLCSVVLLHVNIPSQDPNITNYIRAIRDDLLLCLQYLFK